MISQHRFKAIDDYPSKFDWPGIKGLIFKAFSTNAVILGVDVQVGSSF